MGKIKNYEGRALVYLPNLEKEKFKIYCAERHMNCADVIRAGIIVQKECGIIFGKSQLKGPKEPMEFLLTLFDKNYVKEESRRMNIKETEYLEGCIELGKIALSEERGGYSDTIKTN